MSTNQKIIRHKGRFLALVQEGRWEYVERVNAAGASLILAVTDDDKVLLVEQFRIPVGARTLELPAGLIGDETAENSESASNAARRELLEETGYQAEQMIVLTSGPACSGVTSEVVVLLKASGLKRVGQGGGVEHEDITVHEIPLAEVHAWLKTKAASGVLIDPKIYAGLYFTTQRG